MIPVKPVVVQEEFSMMVPESFVQDTHMAYRYTYFYNEGEFPLGVAVRYAPVRGSQARQRMIGTYFADRQHEAMEGAHNSRVLYLETVNPGLYLSIYLIRFAIDMEDGLMLGCFNCSAAYKDEWWPVVSDMLKSLERVSNEAL